MNPLSVSEQLTLTSQSPVLTAVQAGETASRTEMSPSTDVPASRCSLVVPSLHTFAFTGPSKSESHPDYQSRVRLGAYSETLAYHTR